MVQWCHKHVLNYLRREDAGGPSRCGHTAREKDVAMAKGVSLTAASVSLRADRGGGGLGHEVHQLLGRDAPVAVLVDRAPDPALAQGAAAVSLQLQQGSSTGIAAVGRALWRDHGHSLWLLHGLWRQLCPALHGHLFGVGAGGDPDDGGIRSGLTLDRPPCGTN